VTAFEELAEAVRPLAEQISASYWDALRRYEPEVEHIVTSGSHDVKRIEQVLDGLLDFGDDEDILRLYKRLCRHYWTLDKIAAAEYVMIYRDMWDLESAPPREPAP